MFDPIDLNPLYDLISLDETDAALDWLYSSLTYLMESGQLEKVNAFLSEAAFDKLNVDVMLGILTVTLYYRVELSNRKVFYDKTWAEIQKIEPSDIEEGFTHKDIIDGLR